MKWRRKDLGGVVQSIQQSTVEMSNVASALKEAQEPTVSASSRLSRSSAKPWTNHAPNRTSCRGSRTCTASHGNDGLSLGREQQELPDSTALLRKHFRFQAAQAETMAKVQDNLEQHAAAASNLPPRPFKVHRPL